MEHLQSLLSNSISPYKKGNSPWVGKVKGIKDNGGWLNVTNKDKDKGGWLKIMNKDKG